MQQNPNPPALFGIDDRVFMEVIHRGDLRQRISLATQLAAFIRADETSAAEREQAIPAALKLTADPEPAVRRALARGFADDPKLHADLLFAIVSDDDAIAIPFLAATPALTHWHMLAVLRVGDVVRQATVACRADLSREAVDYIIESLPLAINLLLFENDAVSLTREQYQGLYDRFGETPEMLDRLLNDAALPVDLRVAHARRAAARMQKLVIDRGWMPANDAVDMVADAEENAVLDILTHAGEAKLAPAVAALVDGEMLTPAIIVRAACLGAMDVVVHTVAYLAGISVKRAEAMMFGRRGSFRKLHAKSGLPQSCYWTLQAACDVAREQAEDGITLSADDFGRRMIETLLTRYEALPLAERPKQLDYVGRFAADRARLIANRIRADLARAA